MTGSRCIQVPDAGARGCAFCAYLAGEREYAIVVRSPLVAVMVTQEPRGEPHLLVAPVRHRETILDLDDEEAAEIMVATREVARAIDAVFCRPGIAVWQNNGIPAEQAINHLHIHIAGTLNEGGTERGHVTERSLAEAQGTANRIRPYLSHVGSG
jgi:histidine triad (HIT) family protein